MVGSCQATTSQTARRHIEIPAVFLNHNVRGQFRGSKQGMFRLIDGKGFCNAMSSFLVTVIPTFVEFDQRNRIGRVPINFIGRHAYERILQAIAPCGLQEIQRTDSIRLEIIERNLCSQIVRWLGSSMNDQLRPQFTNKSVNSVPVADIEFMVPKTRYSVGDSALVPSSITLRTEEYSS